MVKNYEILDWDSEFFGFPVGRLEKDVLLKENPKDCLESLYEDEIKLVYYYSDVPLQEDMKSEYYDFLLVDEKVPLRKPLNKEARFHPKVSHYEENFPNEELILLARQAGLHTRFSVDPNIPEEKYNELFKIWITKSVQKKIASDVLVYKENGKILGFATIRIDEEGPYAALLAVDREHEGKGVSFALMMAVEHLLLQRGYTHVSGATQAKNRKALIVYQRQGLEKQKTEYVYHLWKK